MAPPIGFASAFLPRVSAHQSTEEVKKTLGIYSLFFSSSQLWFRSLYNLCCRYKNAKFYRIKVYCAAIMFAAANLQFAATDIFILLHQISNCGLTADDTVIAVRRLT